MTTPTATIDFTDPAVQADPYPVYARLRAEAPMLWNGSGWLVSRYADVEALFRDPRLSSARADATFAVLPEAVQEELQPLRRAMSGRMLLMDPPEHTRLRTLMTRAFSARMMEAKRDRIQGICDELLGRAAGRATIEVMAELAYPLPGLVIADVLGAPVADQAQFVRWARDQVRVYDRPGTANDRVGVMRRGQASMLEMRAYLEGVIAERRRAPRDDLLTTLIQVEEQGDRLSVDEMVVMVLAIMVGGNNSTAHLIGNAVLTLLRHPAALARLRAAPALIATAIDEVMRYDSPVQATSRVVREPISLHGATLMPGQNVSLLIGSANRDPDQFPDADRFDPAREPNRHLTFAHGAHYCLGAALARAEAQIAVLSLLRRYPNLRLAGDRVDWAPGFSFRSLASLPVALD